MSSDRGKIQQTCEFVILSTGIGKMIRNMDRGGKRSRRGPFVCLLISRDEDNEGREGTRYVHEASSLSSAIVANVLYRHFVAAIA